MLTFRVRVHPHNSLLDLASYHVNAVQTMLAEDNKDELVLECTSAIIALAFSVEAILNFVGSTKLGQEWKERAKYARKIEVLELALGFTYSKRMEPYRTLEMLKDARDMLAHGKPMNFCVDASNANELGARLRPQWSEATTPDAVLSAYDHVLAFKADLMKRAKIKPGAELTAAAFP